MAESEVTPIRSHPVLRGLSQDGLCALDENQWTAVEQEARLAHVPVLFHVVKKDLIPAARLMAYLSRRYRMSMLDLDAVQLDDLLLSRIDKKLMNRYVVLPLSQHGETLYLAMADPTDFKAVEDIKFHTGWQVMPILVEADKLMRAVHLITDAGTGIDAVFLEKPADSEADAEADAQKEVDLSLDSETTAEDAPVVRFVQQLLLDAIRKGVSDIHLEPYEKDFRVRYRLDGVLSNAANPSKDLQDGVTSRLKIMCGLDISERRLPQDGRLRVRVPPARVIDFRVSFLPTSFGETIVLRLLDPASSRVPIEQLGFFPEQRKSFEDAIHRPYGMILVTGPTGSGKTVGNK